MLQTIRHSVVGIIDFFHRPFSRWIDVQTFRYLACGGSNVLLDFFLYLFFYFVVLQQHDVHLGFATVGSAIAANTMSFCISFPMGFLLSRYIVFPESTLRGRVQLFRYSLIVGMCFILNYVFMKLYGGVLSFTLSGMMSASARAVMSKLLTTGTVAVFSYVSQRHFTFKVKEAIAD